MNNAPAPTPLNGIWKDPTPEMLQDPLFEAIWQRIKSWDINVPEVYQGYCGASGNHARAIYDAILAILPKQEWPALDDDLREILGRPNFACARIAQAFRENAGAEIKTRAEDEQAFVLHWLTGLYLKYGSEWRKFAADELPLPTPPESRVG